MDSAFASDMKKIFYDWQGANVKLFHDINNIRGTDYDTTMLLVSDLSDHHKFPYYVGVIAIFVALAALIRLIRGAAGNRYFFSSWLAIFLMLGAGYAVNGGVIKLIKNSLEMPRPYIALPEGSVNVLEQKPPEDNYTSFPSGHVAFATMMVIVLMPQLSAGLILLGMLWIPLVMWSRISLGVHFPADVVGAFAITVVVMSILRNIVYGILRSVFGLQC